MLKENEYCYSQSRFMKKTILNRATKFNMYKSIMRPVVTYSCVKWFIIIRDTEKLKIFERKILRKIFGILQDGQNRTRTNHELYSVTMKP